MLLAMAILAAAIPVLLALLRCALRLVELEWHCHMPLSQKQSIEPEIISIEESPLPTRNLSSPRPSPFLPVRRVRRAGAVRLRMHRRRKTLFFNPSLPNHCGYQAVLRAAGLRTDISHVRWLRKRVSEEFYKARLESRSIAGVDPHQLLVQEGKSLAAYCREIAEEQWASIVEVGLASEILKTPVWYCAESCVRLGHGVPAHAVRKLGSHYVLQKMHTKKTADNL